MSHLTLIQAHKGTEKMKTRRDTLASILLALCLIATSCDTMSNSQKGYVAGTVGGTVLGAGLGAALGGGHGADLGAHLGMAVGGVAGAAVGANEDAKQARRAVAQSAASAGSETDDGVSYYDESTGLYYTKVSRDNCILFDSRSCELSGRSCRELLRIAAELRDVPFSEIMIYGSTDDTESRDYSMELSVERAETVRDYFVVLGFDARLLTTVGLSSKYPVADNSTLDGRAQNRCVEVYIVNK